MSSAPTGTTRLGHFLGPQGVKGGVRLFVLGDPEQLLGLERVWVEGWGWLKVTGVQQTFPGAALQLSGIATREAAADLRGLNVYAADDELPKLEEGSYYYHDLRGLEVWRAGEGEAAKADAEHLGEVVDVLDMGYGDLLQVSHAWGESLVPLQAPYVTVEETGGLPSRVLLTADTPEGLLGDPPETGQSEMDG